MKVLLVHNEYQRPGGEDQVFAAEAMLLERAGHDVTRYEARNADIAQRSLLRVGADAIWNRRVLDDLGDVVRRRRPEVVHFHNTFPIISPAAYVAARRGGAAVVQTLHNYRLICPNAMLFRDGHPCEDCVPKRVRWPGVVHRCYRDSLAASGLVAAMLGFHEARGTWRRDVDAYIALTDFARQRFLEGGLPPRRLFVKPNFLADDPGLGPGDGGYALFVGRLTAEKGVRTLLDAWSAHAPGMPLRVVGSGPLEDEVEAVSRAVPAVEWLGQRDRGDVLQLMQRAAVLVFPSHWYEGMPMTILEAFATGLPVVASEVGALPSIVESGATGLLVAPGDGAALAAAVRNLGDQETRVPMRQRARASFEATYTPERNLGLMLEIYRGAVRSASARS